MSGMKRRIRFASLVMVLGMTGMAWSVGGCGALPELPNPDLHLPGLANFVQPDPAITTSIRDAVTEVPFLDEFGSSDPAPLSRLPRGPNNGFLLTASGLFSMNTRSYCLHAGTYGPTAGEGYLYAPLSGPRAALIKRLVQNSVDHPEIPQRDIQALVWAVLAHARLQNTSRDIQRTAAALLSQDDLRSLDEVALDVLSEAVRERAYRNLPAQARRVLRAEDNLRRILARGQSTYDEMERTAVLVGVPPREPDDRDVPRGRWSFHPNGYFVRYFPEGYPRTEVQVYVPEPVAFHRDYQGRIVTVADRKGNRVEVEFNEGSAALDLPAATGLTGHAFNSIRISRYEAVGPEVALEETDTLAASGWTFLGALPEGGPADIGDIGAGQTRAFPDVTHRYQAAREFEGELYALAGEVSNLGGNVGRGSPGNADLMDLAHLDEALRAAVEEIGGPNLSAGATGASLDLVTKAWLFLLVSDNPGLGEDRIGWGSASNWDLASGLSAAFDMGRGIGLGPTFGWRPDSQPMTPEAWWPVVAAHWIPQEQGICDDIPQDQGEGEEFDPSDGTATPGSTGRQRLLPSAASSDDEDPDCGKVDALLEQLKKVRDAYNSTPPRQGESGVEYGKRIEEGVFGLGKPGGATSPMQTHMGACVILGNPAYYESQPGVVRESDCAHERVHQTTCRWAREKAAGAYEGWTVNPENYRTDELNAYAAGIKVLEDWKAANGCSQ